MINNHWTCYGTEKSFVPNEDKFGFVYIITNTKNGKAYVGCKQYYIGKSKKQSRWQTYTGSSKYLNEDIKKIGKKYFTFEVIAEYKNKRSLRYYEMYYQVKWNVLTATVEGSDKRAYYNSYVGGKFFPRGLQFSIILSGSNSFIVTSADSSFASDAIASGSITSMSSSSPFLLSYSSFG